MSAQESRPGRTGAASQESLVGDTLIVSDCRADVSDLATMPANEWRAWIDGYRVGVNHGHQAADEAADARTGASFREAAAILRRASSWPVVDERVVTASSEDLTAMAADREAAGVDRFRADHARRFAAAGGEHR